MPNWCENKLLIFGDGKDALDDFNRIEKLLDETLKYDSESGYVENLLDALICMPDVLKDTTEDKEIRNALNRLVSKDKVIKVTKRIYKVND